MTGFTKGVRLVDGSYKYRFKVRGKIYQGDTGLIDIRKAQAWVDAEKGRLKHTRSIAALDAQHRETLTSVEPIPLSESFAHFLSLPKDRENPKGQYLKTTQSQWNDFVQYLTDNGKEHIAQISETEARSYINHLKQNGRWRREIISRKAKRGFAKGFSARSSLSNRSVNAYHKSCQYIMKVLLQKTQTRNPFAFSKMPKSAQPRRIFDLQTINAIMAEADDFTKKIARMGLLTGKRRNEICMLEWADIQISGSLDDCILPFSIERREDGTRRKKTGTVPITGPLREFLSELMGQRDKALQNAGPRQQVFIDKYVLPEHAKAHMRNPDIVSRRFTKMLLELETATPQVTIQIPGRDRAASVLGIHSLRHTFIFNLAKQQVPADIAMGIVGHLSDEVHAQYRDHFKSSDRLRVLEEATSAIETKESHPTSSKTDLVEALKAALKDADPADKMAIIQQLL